MIAVCIVTYNQESFITQTIESVLMQKCDETLRIYIGDDASTDGTTAICKKFAQQDQRIVYVRREQNIGLVDNTIDLYQRIMLDGCEFTAMLDGDDYWIDSNKLQLQIDYLRTHPEIGLVHTAVYDDINGQLIDLDSTHKPIGDLSLSYNYSGSDHTNCTVVFRTSLLQKNELYAISAQHFIALDYILYGLFAQRTKFGYIYQHTAAWRNHHSVSRPNSISTHLRYYKYRIRAWHWLEQQYPGHFHFRWYKAIIWYSWQVIYAFIHFSKIYLRNFYILFAHSKKML